MKQACEDVLFSPNAKANRGIPVIPQAAAALLAEEVNRLPAEQILVRNGTYLSCLATAEQIPYTLYEIGRLRELTFRAVCEGTGMEIDLDWFDAHYLHLFLWNAKENEVVGAYRLGPTDL